MAFFIVSSITFSLFHCLIIFRFLCDLLIGTHRLIHCLKSCWCHICDIDEIIIFYFAMTHKSFCILPTFHRWVFYCLITFSFLNSLLHGTLPLIHCLKVSQNHIRYIEEIIFIDFAMKQRFLCWSIVYFQRRTWGEERVCASMQSTPSLPSRSELNALQWLVCKKRRLGFIRWFIYFDSLLEILSMLHLLHWWYYHFWFYIETKALLLTYCTFSKTSVMLNPVKVVR